MITAPKVHPDTLWDVSLLFLILAILYVVCIFFLRNTHIFTSKKTRLRKKELAPMVSEFLFYEQNSSKEEDTNYVNLKIEIRELLKDPLNQKVFSEILFDLQKDVSGQVLSRLRKLYIDLGLDKTAYSKLKSWRWHVVSQGILELTNMRVPSSYSVIKKYINNKKGIIRKQAEIATVSLKPQGISYFLDTTTFKISEWQQLKMLDVLKNFEDFQPPRFKAWFTSNNKDVVLFALRLAKYYNQNDANSSIIELIKHKNNKIKTEAIHCIKEFHILNAVEPLKNIFWKCTPSIKLLILDAIKSLGDKNDLPFLQLVAKKESNFPVKSKALGAINTISPESILPTKGIDNKLKNTSWKEVLEYDQENEEYIPVQENNLNEPSYNPSDDLSLKVQGEHISEQLENTTIVTEEIKSDISPIKIESLENTFELDLTQNEENIQNISVVFEEVILNNTDYTIEQSNIQEPIDMISPDELEKELNFLPIVIDNEIHEKSVEDIDYENQLKSDILKFDNEEISISFLPHIVEETEDESRLKDIEVVYDEIVIEKTTTLKTESIPKVEELAIKDFNINFIPVVESNVENQYTKESNVEINEIETEDTIKKIIPKPDFPEMTVQEKANQLLDDIEELGDEREVSFLNDLSNNEEYSCYSNRIQNLIKKFSTNNTELIKEDEALKPFCIFEDLFRVCDTESKLILMDEIVAVGDEKEILFLTNLLEDKDSNIRKKAEKLLKELQNKMMLKSILPLSVSKKMSQKTINEQYTSLMNELEIKSADKDDFFEIDFEFTEDLNKKNKTQSSTFLNYICSFPNKIIDKFNG